MSTFSTGHIEAKFWIMHVFYLFSVQILSFFVQIWALWAPNKICSSGNFLQAFSKKKNWPKSNILPQNRQCIYIQTGDNFSVKTPQECNTSNIRSYLRFSLHFVRKKTYFVFEIKELVFTNCSN